MQEISIYLNPRAGQGANAHWRDSIQKGLFRSSLLFRTPDNIDELRQNLISDIERNVRAVVSVGGDGTVNTLIQNLAYTDVGLLVIPGGTANDLAGELGTKGNIKRVIQMIRFGELKRIDLIKINGRYMATNGGLGMGGEVAKAINDLRARMPIFKKVMQLGGKSIYSFFVAKELMGLELPRYQFQIESAEMNWEGESGIVLVNNQPFIAGRLPVAPGTNNEDGQFNVTIFKHKSRAKLMRCFYHLLQGEMPQDDEILSFETSKLKVTKMGGGRNLTFFGDGELFTRESSEQCFEIEIAKSALNVYTRSAEQRLEDLCNEVNLQ